MCKLTCLLGYYRYPIGKTPPQLSVRDRSIYNFKVVRFSSLVHYCFVMENSNSECPVVPQSSNLEIWQSSNLEILRSGSEEPLFDVEAWRTEVARRKHAMLDDSVVHAMAKLLGSLTFKNPNTPNWPEWNADKAVFGAVRFYNKGFRIQRNLHGYNVILAYGKMLPAHAARLSDLIELVFGKYRFEQARARWNFSEKLAQIDFGQEPQMAKTVRDLENLMLERGILPDYKNLPALRAAAKLISSRVAVRRVDKLSALESAMGVALDELRDNIKERADGIERLSLRWDELKHRMDNLEHRLNECECEKIN